MSGLRDQHVLILGLGVSGLAMARWCAAQGARVTVADTREAPPGLQALSEQAPQARFIAGPLDARLLDDASLRAVCRSPGLAPADVASLVQAARERGLPVWGELDLFTQALADLRAERGYAPKLIAITGTNGKTTVTALTGQLLARAGLLAATAGNIGPSLLDTLSERLRGDALPQVWVLELSSFQLEGNTSFEPTVATVLNVTQDHLDWHGDMAAYAAAKARVFGALGAMVLNRDDPRVSAMRPQAPAKGKGPKPAPRRIITFGAGMPTEPGDFGIEMVNGMAWLVRALEADETQRRRKGADTGSEIELHLQRLMPADALRIRGRHNAVNALAALALAVSVGCPLGPMLYGLREYRGEPHRLESIGVLDGVEYFDDSKGTNVGATVAALQGLGAERQLVVILGGEGKGQDFAPLREPLTRHARAALLIGRDAGLIRAALDGAGVPLIDADSLEQAVDLARERARAGDAVLLSPACASLDMFRDYAHRAEVFRAAVGALAHDEGLNLETAVDRFLPSGIPRGL
ncbi:MAG: UDP-N-acetylmuramoyl-L-alanine--D-glutamate ligase [Burkholderiaceae bacterium]|jgi:UDP-N-acetylmuramoylalanine--D-glutamate ligase|nr:UDP-N-acetylmuramoyl-L-alanine--D-glutamate ligase [Burkholderiaceae bacterium]